MLNEIDPKPVTGSQPLVAVNPAVQQVPAIISLKNEGLAYKLGLMKPTVGNPARCRFEFTNVTRAAATGADAEVP